MAKLALDGGAQACPPGTITPWPMFDQSEERALRRVLESRKWWRIPGQEVDAFERAFAAFVDVEHALAVTNGTQALELSLSSLGIGYGDEVIVPAFTFASTATAVVCAAATPVAVDVELDTYCMSPAAVERAITPRTKAVIPVHLAGQPCDVDAIQRLAARHGLKVIADAAHAHGARWRGTSVARACDVAIYSFQSGKLITAGEGGMLVTRDPQVAELAFLKSSCGRARTDRVYAHDVLGTNARMSEFHGAVLAAQLARLPAQLQEREAAADRLDRALGTLPGLHLQRRTEGVSIHAHYMYMVRVDEDVAGVRRDWLVDALVAEGVPAYRSYRAIPDLGMFAQGRLWAGSPPESLRPDAVREALSRHDAPVSRELAARSLWLHHTVLLGGKRVQDAVAGAFQKVIRAGREAPARAPATTEARAG